MNGFLAHFFSFFICIFFRAIKINRHSIIVHLAEMQSAGAMIYGVNGDMFSEADDDRGGR